MSETCEFCLLPIDADPERTVRNTWRHQEWPECVSALRAALAAAERERDEARRLYEVAQQRFLGTARERDAANAEVERLRAALVAARCAAHPPEPDPLTRALDLLESVEPYLRRAVGLEEAARALMMLPLDVPVRFVDALLQAEHDLSAALDTMPPNPLEHTRALLHDHGRTL